MIKVKDNDSYARLDGGCIINTNMTDYEKALQRKKNANRINELESRIGVMESKLDTILELLKSRITDNDN